jgi:hypothetical protein
MFDEADLIHRYSRADALRDGELIDVSATAREAGIRWPDQGRRAVAVVVTDVDAETDFRPATPADGAAEQVDNIPETSRFVLAGHAGRVPRMVRYGPLGFTPSFALSRYRGCAWG